AKDIAELGYNYDILRQAEISNRNVGLTKLYNCFHDANDRDPGIERLREMHRELDLTVVRAFGWTDLDLRHDFHPVPYLPENDRVRFTLAESARLEILRRLAELNRRRYEEEVDQ